MKSFKTFFKHASMSNYWTCFQKLLVIFFKEVTKCYKDNTFMMNETIADSNIYNYDSDVKEKNSLFGKFYTYHNIHNKVTGANSIVFGLHPNRSYYIFVHDVKFILYTFRPATFPGIKRKYKVTFRYQKFQEKIKFLQRTEPSAGERHFISVVEHHLLDRKERPCEVIYEKGSSII